MPFLLLNWKWLLSGTLAAIVAGWLTHRIDLSQLDALKLQYAEAQQKALATALSQQAEIDRATLDAAVKAAAAEVKTITVTNTITKWATKYVKDIPDCPSVDMLRVHDAAALGTDPASLTQGPEQPDGKPAAVSSSAFSSAIVENYGRCRQTAERLRGLQAWVRDVCETPTPAQ